MSTSNEAAASTANDATPDDDEAEHSVPATKALAQEIHDAMQAAEIGEDVWDTIEVKEPTNTLSTVLFTVEGDRGLMYTVQLVPKVD